MDIIVLAQDGTQEKRFPAELGKTLLKQLEENGVEIVTACKIGTCGSCMCEIVSDPDMINKSMRTEPAFPLADQEVMTCIGGIHKDADMSQDIILKKLY